MVSTHPPGRPLQGTHLRQVSTGSLALAKSSTVEEPDAQAPASSTQPSKGLAQQPFILSIHDDHLSKHDVVLKVSSNHVVHDSDLLQLTPVASSKASGGSGDTRKRLHFLHRAADADVLQKQPGLQVSVSSRIAAAFNFEKGTSVLVSTVDEHVCNATHVEIVVRDQYLARADMWNLIAQELVGTCIYRGQKIEFLGSIRLHIKNIFIRGRKFQSAFFHQSTKPIFRSESAHYVIFIQMSKEMWDFDECGTGDVMFDKVINGFLPELFKRWRELKVKHRVTIVLFTKMVYANHVMTPPNLDADKGSHPTTGSEDSSKDFYRVVVSDMVEEWAVILNQLKKEFKVFLRDISIIKKPSIGGSTSLDTTETIHAISGRPSAAMSANILEAINMASFQFSSDYIDRDLSRTGTSVVIISPGTGVFNVDYKKLVATTKNLIEIGVSIDLVCLSKMPLHSTPLFRYRAPPVGPAAKRSVVSDEKTPTGSFVSNVSSGTPPTLSVPDGLRLHRGLSVGSTKKDKWYYGIPHWIDISFWEQPADTVEDQIVSNKSKSIFDTPQHKTFVPRVKMYEIQMMGVMQNAISDISVPQLSQTFSPFTKANSSAVTNQGRGPLKTINQPSVSNSFTSQRNELYDYPQKLSTSVASDRSTNLGITQSQYQYMDAYDSMVFRDPKAAQKRARHMKKAKTSSNHRYSPSLLGTSADSRNPPAKTKQSHSDERYVNKDNMKPPLSRERQSKQAETGESSSVKPLARPLSKRSMRQISFGPQGKAVASIGVTTKHEVGSLLSRGFKSGFLAKGTGQPNTSPAQSSTCKRPVSPSSRIVNSETQSSESDSTQSKPIAIRVGGDRRQTTQDRKSRALDPESPFQDRLTALQDVGESEKDLYLRELDDDVPYRPIALSPSTTLAPWLTILNPSNPSKTKIAQASRLGRWQHVFPKPLKTSQIKWKSLCTPAAVPLTTEDFPSSEQFAEEYESSAYEIDLRESSELLEKPRSLAAELLAFRLSRGFQLVIGSCPASIIKTPSMQTLDVFDEGVLAENGSSVFLVRGSMIHQVSRLRGDRLEVKQFFRRGAETVHDPGTEPILYKPLVRSMLGDKYEPREVAFAPDCNIFDWKMIDSFVIGHEKPQAAEFVANLRPWQLRFVLIPVEAPSSERRRVRSDVDDEEEVRLEGIRKLTQVWQRFRFNPPNERQYQLPTRNRVDTNPLDIMYQTRNPSAIIAAEMENVAEGDATGQLLPDSDLLERSNITIRSLAETIQSDKGVRMLDRRWHLRLHYNCFIGFELTSWLLQNFRDIDSRELAEEFGNELMTNGMFKHVEQRHNFRDGMYFYQIADEFRTPRPESKGWFGRTKASVPSTPMSEDMPKEFTGRSRSSSKSNSAEDDDPTTPIVKKKQLGVALSKSLIYDVDHRKRSYRPELINLHYDRLHNPDNCYHIRVEWMNTTPKLIQDAVTSWATSVERFGLRLVEVPLAEISSTTSTHPFRAPHLIRLAQPPPKKQPQGYFDTASLGPRPRTEKNFYQKAIMKRFNFVLDFEAASDFPADVDVTYSWGKPDYHYPQYIHRSGMLIAQITDDGNFLLLANRLYNNRNTIPLSQKEPHQFQLNQPSENDQFKSPGFFRSSPHRGTHAPLHRPSPLHSPYPSPSTSATLHPPPTDPQPASPTTFPKHIDPTRPSPTIANSPNAIKRDFESFCSNAEALTMFYEEVLSKASTPGPNTPFMGGKTPRKMAEAGGEGAIPILALPGRLVEGNVREK